jgi:ABC-type sugar transport system permease subunit
MAVRTSIPGAGGVRSKWTPFIFLAPYLALTCVFFIYPFFNAIWLAFHQTNGPTRAVFVGLDNFRFVLSDPDFHTAVWNTTIFAFFSVFLQLPLSLGLALLLNRGDSRLRNAFRLVLFSPQLVGSVFVGILFGMLFTPRFGLFNRLVQALIAWGLEERWLANPSLVMPALVIVALWMWVGFNMIYFLAALQTVDQSLVEAARIDGAGPWGVFWHVTVPAIKPVAVFVVVMSTIGSFQLFELPFTMMQGPGPNQAGLTVVMYLYQRGFDTGNLGYASAIGWTLAAVIFVVSMAQVAVTGGFRKNA